MSINIGAIHVGEAIEERLKSLKITQAEFAKMLKVTQPSVNVLLKKSSMDTEKLKIISRLLDYNFFEDFCPDLKRNNKDLQENGDNNNETSKELFKIISFLRQEINNKSIEIEKLNEVIDMLASTKNKESSGNIKIGNV